MKDRYTDWKINNTLILAMGKGQNLKKKTVEK